MKATLGNEYLQLPERCFSPAIASPTPNAELIVFNTSLAEELGIRAFFENDRERALVFSGNKLLEDTKPIALAYAGHQFGSFNPQLGDGRALFLGDTRDHHGILKDIQLKGSGPTPYSRRGDGKSALGPVLREYLLSESMHALGVPTTRALAAVRTGELVRRETELPGGIFTRVASSHLRIGSFEYLAARNDIDSLKAVANFAIDRHYPECRHEKNLYLAFLQAVIGAQAKLIAKWLSIGFIHGVMNTDNMSVSGETIDYGPCAFIDKYDPYSVFSFIDRDSRYAFGNQPTIARWNLSMLASTLLPILDDNSEKAVLIANIAVESFQEIFKEAWLGEMRSKLGLTLNMPNDEILILELLDGMHQNEKDFTLTFHSLPSLLSENCSEKWLSPWLSKWKKRLNLEPVSLDKIASNLAEKNPICIPRNHCIERVIKAAVEDNDDQPFLKLLKVCTSPFSKFAGSDWAYMPPEPSEVVPYTYCGT